MRQDQEKLRIVIVGGVAGGATAAARARRVNAHAEITILEKGPAVSFANCGLPYHLGGEIEQRSKLLVATAELFWKRFRIHVRTQHEVQHIDRSKRVVLGTTAGGDTFELPYDRLILSTGSEPIRPPFFQPNSKNVFHLWTLDDMDHILSVMGTQKVKRAAVIGAGFVGLEVVEQLVNRGIEVTLIERGSQVLKPLDYELAQMIQDELRKHGVKLHLDAAVETLTYVDGTADAVNLSDGTLIPTDLVIVGAGVSPRTRLAEDAGLELGVTGGVCVNEFMQTKDPDIYAVGDMVEYQHGVLNKPMRIPLAAPANRAGRIAGTHAASGTSPSMGAVFGTCIVRVFDLTAACTGVNERTCKQSTLPYRVATIQAAHHASYFPGAQTMTLKILYEPDNGRLLGAQAVGGDGCDKRIDIAATVLHFGGTVDDLSKLDLAYAPPYGSAKDPIHMAAFVAENDLAAQPSLHEFDATLDKYQVVDVRSPSEIESLPLAGAIRIPVDDLQERWTELDPTLPTVTVCHSGKRAHVAACWLRGQQFELVKNLNGGMALRQHCIKYS